MGRITRLTRRGLIQGGIASSILMPWAGRLARAAAASTRPTNLIVVLCRGAWDATYVLDPKAIGSEHVDGPWRRVAGSTDVDPNEYVARHAGIQLALNDVDRPSVTSFFERHADISVVVNGISMGSIVHDVGRERILTGSRVAGSPDVGAVFGDAHQAGAPIGYLDFSGSGLIGSLGASSARVGSSGQLELLIVDDAGALPGPLGSGWTYPLFLPDSQDADAVAAYLRGREARVTAGLAHNDRDARILADLEASRAAAADLRTAGPELSQYLQLGSTMDIVDQIDLAVNLFTAEPALCRAALIDTDLPWDSHDDNTIQNNNFDTLFAGLGYLAEELGRARLESDTLVVVLSEFTRTPKLNADDGKDHWPVASALLFGAGLSGGRTVGSTDDAQGAEAVDLATGEATGSGSLPDYASFMAGVLEAIDVDPGDLLPGATPFSAVHGR